MTFIPVGGAGGNGLARVTLTNTSGSSCYLGGYVGVALLDAGGHDLQDAQRSTESYFGTYPAPGRVDIPPGNQTTFDLTFSEIDPCGNYAAQHPVGLLVTPPGDTDSATISASPNGQPMTVCPGSLDVHPVGARPNQG
jgi:hypothetical protein